MMNPSCRDCLFWKELTSIPSAGGECHRMPPAVDEQMSRWPTTMGNEWCGCHRPFETIEEAKEPGS